MARPSAGAAAPVIVDTTFAFDAALGPFRGVAAASHAALAAGAADLVARTAKERAAGALAFLDLPHRGDLVAPVVRWAAPRRRAATDVLLVGIGGSSRGAQALAATRPAKGLGTKGRPRLHVLDTVDPARVRDLLGTLSPRSTVLVAISKAGTTLETTAGYLAAEAWLSRALGRRGAAERTALVAGEEANPLRARAEQRGIACFPVPAGVGGRFSALSPVGMLPAALLGIDPRAVLAGAAAVGARGASADPQANPALALALVHQAALAGGRPAAVCLPYADALQPFALWWEQLLAESLGKKGPAGPVGITPVPGVGPSDQHSLLQGLIEGPDHHLTVFLEVEARAKDALRVPKGEDALCVGSGRTFGAVLAAEREATELALLEAGRPSISIRVPDASPRSVGALMFLYETAVLFWGRLAGVDPFGQPSVERIKVLTKASLTGAPADAVAALAKHRATPRRLSR